MQHGFDRLFGLGANSGYFGGRTCTLDGTPITQDPTDFYLTDAISDHAVDFIAASADQPFFMYVAYTAPHWPLHAFEEDIARYQGQYRKGGWDAARTARHEALKDMEIVSSHWDISPRDEDAPPWNEAADPDWEDRRMAVYAAQVDRMDQGIGRILDKLREFDIEDNTLVVFLSDNGGCAEFLCEDGNRIDWVFLKGLTTHDGRPVQMGNIPRSAARCRGHLHELRRALGQCQHHSLPPLQALGPRRRHRPPPASSAGLPPSSNPT